jgi:hypothetical protein
MKKRQSGIKFVVILTILFLFLFFLLLSLLYPFTREGMDTPSSINVNVKGVNKKPLKQQATNPFSQIKVLNPGSPSKLAGNDKTITNMQK